MTAGDRQTSDDTARACARCGEPLGAKAAFCRKCGAGYEEPASPPPEVEDERTAAMAAAPSCGKCAAALAPGAAFCRSCGNPVLVEGPPNQKLDAVPMPSSPPPPPPPSFVPGAPASLPSGGGSRNWPLFVIGALVLLVGAGVAVAIVASKSSGGGSVTTTVEQVALPGPEVNNEEEPGGEMLETTEEPVEAEEERGEAEEEPVEAEEEVRTSGFPEVSRAQMNEEITSLLESYHEDVVDEDFQAAWSMLTLRKRRQYLREYGYHNWASAQASLSPYLDPSGMEANLVALEGEGVARVDVSGMGWSKPGAPCSEWSGLTWVKYEGDGWAYDPGYSTTPSRRSTWRSRSARLLGGDCAE
jgi:Double zinc ribbon